jgi:autotransporter-associated beta strand protein
MKKSLRFMRCNLPQNAAVLAALALMGLTGAASAASGTWTQLTTGGTWAPSETSPWAGGIVAEGIDATADFGTLNITANNTVRYNYSGTIGHLIFADMTPGQSWTLDNNGNAANILTLATSLGGPTITTNSGSNIVGVELTGAQGLTKLGTGILVLSANNSYTGNTTISAGALRIGNGGTTGHVLGNIANSGTLTFNRSDLYTFGGTISGAGRVVTAGLGTTEFTANNTYTGITEVGAGTTLRGSDSTVYAGNADIRTVFGATNSGVISLGGNSRIELRANGQNDASAQTLTLAMAAGKTIQYSSTSATNVAIDIGRESGTGTNKTIRIGVLNFATPTTGTTSINFTGANGYLLEVASVSLGNASSTGTLLLNPTTTSLRVLGNVANGGSGVAKTLELGGTSTGNVISGTILNSASGTTFVTKSNTSTWTLAGNNTYTGATTVNAGTLLVNGSLAAGSAVTVGASGTLGGTGTINGSIAVNGMLAPGVTQGVLTITSSSVTLNDGGGLAIELNGATPGSQYDQLALTNAAGVFSLTNTNNLQLTLGFVPLAGAQFTIVDIAGSNAVAGIFEQLNGVATNLSQGAVFTVGATQFKISYTAEGTTFEGAGNNVMLEVVPEPGACALLGLAGAVLVSFRRRRA